METDSAAIAHVLNRLAFGPRRSDWELVERHGIPGYII